MEFKKGNYIEIGYGEYVPVDNPLDPEDEVELEVEDGGSYFVIVDQDKITEDEIEELVPDNVLYIELIQEDDKDARKWADDNPPLSKMFVSEE